MNKILLDAIVYFLLADEYRNCMSYTIDGYFGFAYLTIHFTDAEVKYKVEVRDDGSEVDWERI